MREGIFIPKEHSTEDIEDQFGDNGMIPPVEDSLSAGPS